MLEKMRSLSFRDTVRLLAILYGVGFWLYIGYCICADRADSADHYERIEATANDIRDAENLARSARSELETAERTAREAESRIDASAEYNTRITESIADNERIIDELRNLADDGERIVETIIRRSGSGTTGAEAR